MKDYYDILGIDKSASKDDVKRAFRKLAAKYHPDKKTGDEAKFKEISEAYSVLGDDKKHAEYDAYGRSYAGGQGGGFGGQWGGFQGGFGQGGVEFDLNDIFENFGDIFGGGVRGSRRQARGPRHLGRHRTLLQGGGLRHDANAPHHEELDVSDVQRLRCEARYRYDHVRRL